MTLPDHSIQAWTQAGGIKIEPYSDDQLQPASYDLLLGDTFASLQPTLPLGVNPIDPAIEQKYDFFKSEGEPFVLQGFCLASTVEKISLPSNIVGRVEGKSSLARLGLFVHVTAGFIDPGFSGYITLELFCAHSRGIKLYPGMPVCQISFERMAEGAASPYSGKYQDQPAGPTPSRYYKNFPLHAQR